MVYKAVQAYLSDKAQAFLPGNSFYPEEDKYASQFDPSSVGIRPVGKPWGFNISVNVQISLYPQQRAHPDHSNDPTSFQCRQNNSAQSINPTINPSAKHPGSILSSESGLPASEPNNAAYPQRVIQQTAFERFMGHGHGYGNSTVRGGIAHFGDNYHYHYSQTQTHFSARRHSMPGSRGPLLSPESETASALAAANDPSNSSAKT